MKSKQMLIVGMFMSAAAMMFSMASFYEVTKAHNEVTQFLKDLVFTDIEEGK